jgi:hypothetical protein
MVKKLKIALHSKNIVRGRQLVSRWFFWRIHLRQMKYLSRADDISSMSADLLLIINPRGWISSVDYKLCCMIFVFSRRYSTKAEDIHLTGMIFIYIRQYSTKPDDAHMKRTIFIRWKRYSFKRDENHLWWLILEISINHWRWNSTTGDENQPLGIIINHWGW